MKGIIFANGDILDYSFYQKYLEKGTIILCCDGGMRHTRALNIFPDYILGDFDSVSAETLAYYKKAGVPFRQFPQRKDETDLELGIRFALELGITDLIILGGIGSRIDHTMANCHLLFLLLKNGVRGRLINEKNEIELIDRYLEIKGKKGKLVSLIPAWGEVQGITLKGMEYPLHNAILPFESPRGVSNVMAGEKAEIFIKEGLVFVIQSKD